MAHIHSHDDWRHDHVYIDEQQAANERRALAVVLLTAVTMVAEISAGLIFNSMALLADGWHMASHAAALGITVFAYWFARRHVRDPQFTFGTGKVGALGGFASAVVLGVVAVLVAFESFDRIVNPLAINFTAAIIVAVVGLVVNLASAWLLNARPHHPGHGHHHGHADHNLRAAFLHVVADALTSVLAILALVGDLFWGIVC